MKVRGEESRRPELVYGLEPRHPAEVLAVVEVVHQQSVEQEVSHREIQTDRLGLPPARQLRLTRT